MYDLTESERQPILQVEALREKDKEIARLRQEITTLGGPASRTEQTSSEYDHLKKRKPICASKSVTKPSNQRQKIVSKNDDIQSTIFSAAPMTNVIKEVSLAFGWCALLRSRSWLS